MTTALEEPPVDDTVDKKASLTQTIDLLREHAYLVDLEVSWFSKQRKMSKSEKQSLVRTDEDEADLSQLTVNLSLFAKNDPDIKAMEDAKRALYSYRDSLTIPSAKLAPTELTEVELEGGDKRLVRKKPGERVIMHGDVDDFDHHVTEILIPNLKKAVERANKNMLQIKARAKETLKKRFREDEFPEQFQCAVTGPDYKQYGLSVEFEEACPSAAARMKEAAQQKYTDTIELAVGDFANSFMSACALAAQQLSHRTKIYPPDDHEYYYLDGAEVQEIFTPADDPSLEEGEMLLEVAYKPGDGGKRKTETVGPLTEAEYNRLNPMEVEQRRKVYQSTFENLLGDLERFQQIREMLGDLANPLDAIVTKVRKLLHDAGDTAHAVTNDMKASNMARKRAAETFADVADAIESVVDQLPVRKAKRRRAIGKR